MLLPQDWDGAVFDELIGPTDPHHRRIDHLRVQIFHHGAAETVVQNVIFDRAHDLDAAREKFERAGVHRLDPARINERNGYGAGYWLWLTSAGLVIVSGATGLVKQK